MNALIDDFQKLISDRDEIISSLASLNFNYIDLKAYKITVEK